VEVKYKLKSANFSSFLLLVGTIVGTVQMKLAKLEAWFSEINQGANLILGSWFADHKEDLATCFAFIQNDYPQFPLKEVFDVIVKGKMKEVSAGSKHALRESESYGSLQEAQMVLRCESERLNKEIPLQNRTWKEVADDVSSAADFLEKSLDDEASHFEGDGRRGGPDPFTYQNLLIYLLSRTIKGSTGKLLDHVVADITGALGYPAISPQAISKRRKNFERLLSKYLDRKARKSSLTPPRYLS